MFVAPLTLKGTIAGRSIDVPLWSYTTGVQLAQQYVKAAGSKRKGFALLLRLYETRGVSTEEHWIELQSFNVGMRSERPEVSPGEAPGAGADAEAGRLAAIQAAAKPKK